MDVFQVVKAMRAQKPGAIQTVVCSDLHYSDVIFLIYLLQEQYQSVYEALLVFIDSFSNFSP